jgi:hypothetical protein
MAIYRNHIYLIITYVARTCYYESMYKSVVIQPMVLCIFTCQVSANTALSFNYVIEEKELWSELHV